MHMSNFKLKVWYHRFVKLWHLQQKKVKLPSM